LIKINNTLPNELPQKRIKLEENKGDGSSTKIQMTLSQASQNPENKPKKPLSAYIYFSQEFREIIRQRFPFLTVAQIMKAVSYRWGQMTKEQKAPFENVANKDKERYDKEVVESKKGQFMGRSTSQLIKLDDQDENVKAALDISDDLL
jgi:hypothetical protein